VGILTENPPQTHSTKKVPKYGITDSKFVITVAPQKDICPQGSTYPTKAVSMLIKMINTPKFHVNFNWNEE